MSTVLYLLLGAILAVGALLIAALISAYKEAKAEIAVLKQRLDAQEK